MMQDALSAPQDFQRDEQTNLFLRNDTLFGVCEGLGEEFGINANWLRVPFAAGVLWNPMAIIGIYLALGAALALARWIYPKPRAAAAVLPLDAGNEPAIAANSDANSEPLAA
jgi:phage shock protein PspC (stress-responsive transcriptional regulator)